RDDHARRSPGTARPAAGDVALPPARGTSPFGGRTTASPGIAPQSTAREPRNLDADDQDLAWRTSMMTLRQFATPPKSILAATSWSLADLGEARGKQELFTKQSPQKLKVLREHALVESAVSSNRIEGVEVEPSRVATIVFGKALLRDREEEEVRGYRN